MDTEYEFHSGDRVLFREWDDPELNKDLVCGGMMYFLGRECTVSERTSDISFTIVEDPDRYYYFNEMVKAIIYTDSVELPDISPDDLNELFY